MTGFEEIEIPRDSNGELQAMIYEIETPDLEFLHIGGADIGLATECVTNSIVLHLSRTKIYKRSAGTRVEIRRARRGAVIAARVVIDPVDLGFIDAGAEAIEKTTTRVGGEVIIRFTVKKGSDEAI